MFLVDLLTLLADLGGLSRSMLERLYCIFLVSFRPNSRVMTAEW